MDKYLIGKKIRYYRKRLNFSQMELELATNSAFGSISRIESGKINPTKETLSSISQSLKLKPSEIADLLGLKIFSPSELVLAINKFTKSLDLKTTLQTAVDIMFDLYPGYNGGCIGLLDTDSKTLYAQTVSNMPNMDKVYKILPTIVPKLNVKLDSEPTNLMVRCIKEDKALQSNDFYGFIKGSVPYPIARLVERYLGFKHGLVMPLKYEGKTIGICWYAKKVDEIFNEDEVDLLTLLSNQIGIAIENSRHYSNISII